MILIFALSFVIQEYSNRFQNECENEVENLDAKSSVHSFVAFKQTKKKLIITQFKLRNEMQGLFLPANSVPNFEISAEFLDRNGSSNLRLFLFA